MPINSLIVVIIIAIVTTSQFIDYKHHRHKHLIILISLTNSYNRHHKPQTYYLIAIINFVILANSLQYLRKHEQFSKHDLSATNRKCYL